MHLRKIRLLFPLGAEMPTSTILLGPHYYLAKPMVDCGASEVRYLYHEWRVILQVFRERPVVLRDRSEPEKWN